MYCGATAFFLTVIEGASGRLLEACCPLQRNGQQAIATMAKSAQLLMDLPGQSGVM
jgi:hypothetical protein